MAEIDDLDIVDANNIARFPEGQQAGSLNNGARATEGMLARGLGDTILSALATTGSGNAYVLTPLRTVSAYVDGLSFRVEVNHTNTAAATLNVSSLGTKDIVTTEGVALYPGALVLGGKYDLVYDGVRFVVLNPSTVRASQDGAFIWCGTAGGTANALTLTPSPAITAYAAGQKFFAITGATPSSSTVTLAVSGLSAQAVQINGAALSATVTLEASKPYLFLHDGTQFQATRLSSDFAAVGKDILPSADSTYDLGAAGRAFAEAYIDQVVVGDGSAASPGLTFAGDTDNGFFLPANNTIAAATDGAERWRTNASGTTFGATAQVDGTYQVQVSGVAGITSTSSSQGLFCRHTGSGTQRVVTFRQGDPSSTVGSIEVVGGSGTSYNSTSDAGLKEHLGFLDIDLCEKIVKGVSARNYRWVTGDKLESSGFFAQDFLPLFPMAVTQTTTPDKSPEEDGYDPVKLDYSKLVIPLWGALQKALSRIEALEEKTDGRA